MRTCYRFANLCGGTFRGGNATFVGNELVVPVGNRISRIDLSENVCLTLPFETRTDVARIALSPKGNLIVVVDKESKATLSSFPAGIPLAHFPFPQPLSTLEFSPDGNLIAAASGKSLRIYKSPAHTPSFAPLALLKTLPGHFDTITAVAFSPDSKMIATASKDASVRIYPLSKVSPFQGAVLSGHSDHVVSVFFSADASTLYSISRDGTLLEWNVEYHLNKSNSSEKDDQEHVDQDDEKSADQPPNNSHASKRQKTTTHGGRLVQRWRPASRHYFNQNHAKVICAAFHAQSNILAVGFDSGIFGLWELPEFVNIQTLSVSKHRISTISFNPSGEWIALGSAKLRQLLVWEWQSESYVLKQQAHEHDMKAIAYSPDGQFIATGGDDAKLKLWNAQSGFSFVTFSEHTAPISAIEFARRGQVVFSASLDGTVRAFDLIRYRNFRTFTSPTPTQFISIAIDPSAEIVVAGSMDTFEIYVWSVQSGRLLEILPGHEGPVSSLAFVPESATNGGLLASASWDKTVRIWDIFARDKQMEVLDHQSEVLALAFLPDGRHIVTSTLNGQICFWDAELAKQIGTIEGRRDISGGRSINDRTTSANSTSDKHFSSLCVSPDGSILIAGGNSKYVCIYDIASRQLARKFQITHNMSLDAMSEFLSTRDLTEAGHKKLIDTADDDASDPEDRLDRTLPGVQSGDKSVRKTLPRARTHCIRFSPSASSWAAATTQGLLMYSLDTTITFDPIDLDMDVTASTVHHYLSTQSYLHALITACRLGDHAILTTVYFSVPSHDIPLMTRSIPQHHLSRILRLIITIFETHPHRIEYHLMWMTNLLKHHGMNIHQHRHMYMPLLRGLSKCVMEVRRDMGNMCMENRFVLEYLVGQCDMEIQKEKQTDQVDADLIMNSLDL